MGNDNQARGPFRFYTRFNLSELTGRKARNLERLLRHIREVPGSCIYHHTHRFVEKHQYLTLEPPNNFAFWVGDVLGEKLLAEKLIGIDTVNHASIRSLREAIVATLENYLAEHPQSRRRLASRGEEFHFVKSISIVIPTPHLARDLKSFIRALQAVSISSIYFHMFEARLRLERATNDFSYWLETSLDKKPLADQIAALDPYSFTLERLREKIVSILRDTRKAEK